MKINNDIETVAEIFFESPDNISSFKGCIEMAETLKEENPTEFNELVIKRCLMNENIEIIDDLISSLYDDYEQEQAYAQEVIQAWIRIKDKFKEQD